MTFIHLNSCLPTGNSSLALKPAYTAISNPTKGAKEKRAIRKAVSVLPYPA